MRYLPSSRRETTASGDCGVMLTELLSLKKMVMLRLTPPTPSEMTLPPIPDSFRWTIEPWGPALRCEPLSAIAAHLFTTRHTPLSVGSDWWPMRIQGGRSMRRCGW